jgi:hypothetical protein
MPGMREDYILRRLPLTRGLSYEHYHRNLDRHETEWSTEPDLSIDDEIAAAKRGAACQSQ